MMIAFATILIVLCLGAMAAAVFHGSVMSKSPEDAAEPGERGSIDVPLHHVRVETITVPTTRPGHDWTASVQEQLDAIEDDDPTLDLVSSVVMGERIVLFYRRRVR